MLRPVLVSAIMWALSTVAPEAASRQGPAERPPVEDALSPIVRVPPYFPPEAPETLDRGWVVIEFTLTGAGAVENPRVLRSSDKIFEDRALRAVRRWKFRPRKIGGVPLAAEKAKTIVTFDRSNSRPRPLVDLPPRRERGAKYAYVQTVVPLSEWTAGILRFRVIEGVSGASRGSGGGVGENGRIFQCAVAYEPKGPGPDERRAVARELMKAYIAAEIRAYETRSGHRVSAGSVHFYSGMPVIILPSGEMVSRGIHAVHFQRTLEGRWELL